MPAKQTDVRQRLLRPILANCLAFVSRFGSIASLSREKRKKSREKKNRAMNRPVDRNRAGFSRMTIV
jgi:hypothetical protein